MKTWKLVLEYDGTRYSGWAEQANTSRTIMGRLREAAEGFFKAPVELAGSGRTDAGVHASAQVAHLRASRRIRVSPRQILEGLNDALPADIAVLEVTEAPPRFHARHSAVSRNYVYRISTRKTAFSKRCVWWVKQPLDVAAMARAATFIPGRHDFVRFCAIDPSKPGQSTIAVVSSARVEKQDDQILFHIEASHFLWRMVRRLAGALVRIGLGELAVHDFEMLIAGGNGRLDVASWTAPASGLCLERVNYRLV